MYHLSQTVKEEVAQLRKKLKRKRNKYGAQKTMFRGILFDSKAEADYYKYLLADKMVKDIQLQPEYTIIEPFKIKCSKCDGNGQFLNGRTNRFNKCRTCKGSGKRTRTKAKYTPDFRVEYVDGLVEVVDIKGSQTEAFRLRRKLWEMKYDTELVVIKKTNKGFTRQ